MSTIARFLGGALLLAPAAASAQSTVYIPDVVELSGAGAVSGTNWRDGVTLAVEEINAKGGILGKQVALDVADDGSGADGAVKAFNSLVLQKNVNAIITMETSAARNAGLPIV